MSEEKLYAVKDDEGEYWDFEFGKFRPVDRVYHPADFDKEHAKAKARDYGGHIVTFVEEPEKVVLSKEQAEIVEDAHDSEIPATFISRHSDGEEFLMEAYVNGYTVAKEKKYLVYKALGGKQKNKLFVQAYRYSIYPGTISWILTNDVENRSFAQFAESEIEQYGLQDCEKVWCDSVD